MIKSFLALVLLLPGLAFSQSVQLDFEAASAEMANSRYDLAIVRLKAIEQMGYISGPLFLNLAVGYTALDSLGMAKYYYIKASAYSDTKVAADKGLQFVENRFRYRTAKLPQLPWDRFFNFLRDVLGIPVLLILSVFSLNLAAIFVAVSWFKAPLKKAVTWIAPALVLFSLASGLSAWKIHSANNRYAEAVQVISDTKILDKPAEDGLLVSNSYEGYTFVVDRKTSAKAENWLYVRMSNGLYGWIPAGSLKTF